MKVTYYPKGTCSVRMDVEVDEAGIIRHVHVEQGCDGNLQGIRCGWKNTSCPDQLSKALQQCLDAIGTKKEM